MTETQNRPSVPRRIAAAVAPLLVVAVVVVTLAVIAENPLRFVLQLALLGLVFTVQGAVLFGLLGYFAGTIGQWLQRKPRAGMWLDRVAGSIFVALGLRLIVTR